MCHPGVQSGMACPEDEGRERDGRMIKIKARPNESVEQLLRRLKKMCEKEGLNKEIKRHSYYEKPSERRRRKVRKAQKKMAQRQAEMGLS